MRRLPPTLLAAVALTGCGGSGGTDELLERLPADTPLVATVDLAEAKERLGLAEDADPTAASRGAGGAERRLLFAAGYALPHLQRPTSDLPIFDALEATEIEAAATAGLRGDEQLTIVRTKQPADEVLEGLDAEGYAREGELVTSDESPFEVVYAAAAEREGLLLLGGSAGVVRRALTAEGGRAGPARALLEELEGSVRVAVSGAGSGCLRAFAGYDRLEPAEGELALRVDGGAQAERSSLGEGGGLVRQLARNARFERPRAERDLLRIPFSYAARQPGLSPLALVTGDVVAGALYRCEGGEAEPRGGDDVDAPGG